jgi:hypothetical protein
MRKKLVLVLVILALSISTSSLTFASDISSLIKDLRKKDTAKEASEKLAKIGNPAVPELIKALEGQNKYQKRYAAKALSEMGQLGADAIPALIKVLEDQDSHTREYAVESLGNMTDQAKQVLPILERTANRDNSDAGEVRRKAEKAIAKIWASIAQRMISENNKKVQERSVQVLDVNDANNFIVFGVPLNASLQEVVSALEKNGIEISGDCLLTDTGKILSDANAFREFLQDKIEGTYDFWKISTPRKEKALKLLEEGKLKGFCYEYKGEKYFAEPTSLTRLLYVKKFPSNPGIYPVLEDFPDIYNSQFLLECDDFPAEMDSQGIGKMLLFFKSIEQKEPTCFLIRLLFGGPNLDKIGKSPSGLSKLLTDKYGIPTLCYSQETPIGKHGNELSFYGREASLGEMGWAANLPMYINWKHLFQIGKCNTTLWGKVNDVTTKASRGGNRDVFPYVNLMRGEVDSRERRGEIYRMWFCDFLFVWDCGKINLTLSGTCVNPESEPLLPTFHQLDYIDLPSVEELNGMYEKLYSASEEAKAKLSEAGKRGF